MSRRRIAIRRGVVLGLLVLSVLLFTSFFRESEGGFLHRLKDTAGGVVTPVQKAAVGAIQPLRDGWSWFADLRGARDEASRLRVENEALRSQITSQALARERLQDFREALKVADDGIGGYRPVSARLIGRPPDLSQRVKLDKGRSQGIVPNSLVFAPHKGESETFGALVGIVTSVTGGSSIVTFITDPSTRIGARILGAAQPLGLLKATASGQLVLDQVPASVQVLEGSTVVTAGYGTLRLPSPYPHDLPVGTVSSVGSREPGATWTVQVEPLRDPLELSIFTVFVPHSAEAKRRAGVGG